MKFEFKDSHDTLDELIAYHGVENIVRVKYTIISDVLGQVLNIMVFRDKRYYKLRYVFFKESWQLWKASASVKYYQEHPGIDEITYIFSMIQAADIVKARV